MRTLRIRRLAALAVLPILVSAAQAQAVRGPYYQRTTTPGFSAPHPAARVAQPPVAPGGWDRLQPYTETSARAGAAELGDVYSSSRSRVAPPRPLPPSPPTARNYYPSARVGQGRNRNVQGGRDHCTPSRGGMIFGLR